jgi:hypothetical protein
MFRSEYKKVLRQCAFTKLQTKALLAILEDTFPAGRDGFIAGWTDGVNSIYRFLCGDMLAHDEFEDDQPTSECEDSDLPKEVLSLLAKTHFDLEPVHLSATQAVARMMPEIAGANGVAFVAAMHSLASLRLRHFIHHFEKAENVEGYFVGKSAWWAFFLRGLDENSV